MLQISPTEGLAEHDVLRVNGTACEIDKIDEDLFTLSDPLETAVQVGTEVSKITRFEGFSLRNLQKHEVYIGHSELLNLEQPSTITLVISPPSAAERLRALDVRFELYGLKEDADEPAWHALSIGNSSGAGIELKKTWQGQVEELEVNGRKARWIRLRLMSPVLGRVTEGTRISRALLQVSSGLLTLGEGSEAASQTIKQAFHNSAPLALSSSFHPFGSAPQLFDTFYLAAPEAFSKKGARVNLDIQLASTSPDASTYHNPELSWEYFDGKTWRRIEASPTDQPVDDVQKRGSVIDLRCNGQIGFEVPEDMSMVKVAGQEDYWIRARLISGDYGRPEYISEMVVHEDDSDTDNGEFETLENDSSQSVTFTQTVTVNTSNLHPPEILSIEASFELTKCSFPDHVLVENNLRLLDQSQANRTASAELELFEGASALDADIEQRGRTLYLGFSRPFDVPSLNLFVDAEEQAQETELVFEVLARDGWRRLGLNDDDPTRGFHRRGMVRINVDTTPRRANLLGSERYWLRVYPRGREGVWAPHLIGVYANAVLAVQAETLSQELLGSSLGEPNQSFYLSKTPVLANGLELRVRERLSEEERTDLAAETGEEAVVTYENIPGDWVLWSRVDSFIGLDGDARVYRLDPATGQVRFGDGKRGRIPPGGRDGIRAVKYRSGGGRQGNLSHFSVGKLKSSIESVEAVTNPVPAAGGVDALPIDQVVATAPARLRHRQQALTPVDIEAIVLSWSPDVVRARCLLPDEQDDRIRIVIARHRDEPRPQPSLAEREALVRYLCERAWGALREQDVLVTGPVYAPVAVEALILADLADRVSVLEKQATEWLQQFLHPTGGGPGGGGWPFGRRIWPSDVLRALAGLEGLDRIERVDIQPLEDTCLDDLPPTALICAQETDIKVSVQVPEGGV